jgi:hypothetical protein
MRKWRFKPFTIDASPVEIEAQTEFNFDLQ